MQAGTTVTTSGCKMVPLAQILFCSEHSCFSPQQLINKTQRMICASQCKGKKTNPKKPAEEMKCCLSRGKAGFLPSRRWDGLNMGIRDTSHSSSHPDHPPACGLLEGWRGWEPACQHGARRSCSPSHCSPPLHCSRSWTNPCRAASWQLPPEPSGFSLPWPGFRAVPR